MVENVVQGWHVLTPGPQKLSNPGVDVLLQGFGSVKYSVDGGIVGGGSPLCWLVLGGGRVKHVYQVCAILDCKEPV